MENHKTKKTLIPKSTTEFLWVGVIFTASLSAISLIPLIPNDFWWHLKVGEIIYVSKSVPKVNIFAWSLPYDFPYFYGAWLGELLFFLVYKIGQVPLIIFTRNLLGGLVLIILGINLHYRSHSWRISALILGLFFLMFWYNGGVRTQMWAWLPFIAFFLLLDAYSNKRIKPYLLLFLPALMILWTNLHGSFILGIVMIAIFLGSELLLKVFHHRDANSCSSIIWLAIILLITTSTILINPRGFEIIQYLHHMLTDQPTQSLIPEWLPPTPSTLGNIVFYISILILIVSLTYSQYKPRLTELMLIIAFLWLAWNGGRYIIWYAILVTPTLASLISQLPISIPKIETQHNYINTILIILMIIPIVLVQPWFAEKLPLPDRYKQMILPPNEVGPLLGKETPIYASIFLKTQPRGKLFNDATFASYLIWANSEQPVFIDLRAEMFPLQLWEDYLSISEGCDIERLLEKYKIDQIILNRDLQQGLEFALNESELWTLEYSDDIAQIWQRNKSYSE